MVGSGVDVGMMVAAGVAGTTVAVGATVGTGVLVGADLSWLQAATVRTMMDKTMVRRKLDSV